MMTDEALAFAEARARDALPELYRRVLDAWLYETHGDVAEDVAWLAERFDRDEGEIRLIILQAWSAYRVMRGAWLDAARC